VNPISVFGFNAETRSRRAAKGEAVFEGNGWAVKIMANSMDNLFADNNFLVNSFDVATNSRQNFNTFAGLRSLKYGDDWF